MVTQFVDFVRSVGLLFVSDVCVCRLRQARKQAMASKYIDPSQLLGFVGGQSQWLFEPSAYFSNDGASL